MHVPPPPSAPLHIVCGSQHVRASLHASPGAAHDARQRVCPLPSSTHRPAPSQQSESSWQICPSSEHTAPGGKHCCVPLFGSSTQFKPSQHSSSAAHVSPVSEHASAGGTHCATPPTGRHSPSPQHAASESHR